jgi:ATP-binding cassette subfamily F protein 3
MIKLDNISKSYGADTLFDGLDWHVPRGDFIGLVGPNGAGKTTLCEIMAGQREPDTGRVVVPKNVRVGYMPQEMGEMRRNMTLLDVVLEGAEELLDMEDELEGIEQRMEEADNDENVELSGRYSELQETFRQRGGYQIRSQAREIAVGLGFTTDDFERPIDTFSGGWRMRAVLGRLLLMAPDLLLLDEPTNHLDLGSLQWLESFLRSYDGTIITISHDRYFLNSLADGVTELAKGKLRHFEGGYDDYRRQRREMRERLKAEAKEQQKEIDEIEEFISKFRYNASKASMVQSRIKRLEKMEPIEVPDPLETDVSFEFPQPPRVGKTVVETRNLAKSFDETTVYSDLDFTVFRGEKIAFVGPNGAGKSTLMKMLAGDLEPDAGSVSFGNRVDVSYFAQHSLDQLDPEDTIFEAMEEAASTDAYPRIRDILGAFGFSDDSVHKSVSVLSGGEKARVALARMLLEPAGLLLLDEPTNHLDIPSVQVLEKALSDFEGAVCVISHDRYFLNEVVDKVIYIEDGEVTEYPGDYEYFKYKHGENVQGAATTTGSTQAEDDEAAEEGQGDQAPDEEVSRKERRQIRAQLRRERRDETEALRERLEEIETRIEELEGRIDELETQLADPDTYEGDGDVEALQREHGELESELESLMLEWEEKGAELEEIRARYEERAEELCGG